MTKPIDTAIEADDNQMIAIVKAANATPEQRKALWSKRYQTMNALQREFRSEQAYCSYMESVVTGRTRVLKGNVGS